MTYIFNVTRLCGSYNWTVWNNQTNDFGQCFYSVAVVNPCHALLAILSSYFIGLKSRPYYLRTQLQKWVLYLRGLAVLGLAVTPVISLIASYALGVNILMQVGLSYYVEECLEVFSWLIHFIYVMCLLERVSPSIRGKRLMIMVLIMVTLVDCLQCRSILVNSFREPLLTTVSRIHAIVRLSCLAMYFFSLIPAGDDSESHYEEILTTNEGRNERSSLIRSTHSPNDYGGFHEEADPNYLGVAGEGSNWLSQLFLYYVNPLILKGRKDLLKTTDDLFDLSTKLSTHYNSELFEGKINDPTFESNILKILFHLYGKEFFLIGILKFIADCAGFSSPLLLNYLITFMEDVHQDIRKGYLYAFGLAISTFTVALCNTHFNLRINELKLKVRGAIVTAVYQHVIDVPSVQLNKFNTGEVINYMSTDTDRVVNFAPSLHAVWSLPFQLIVTVGLLWQQLGISSLAGVGITILMIPLNKLVADKIGTLSTQMMTAKDERVQSMSELLSGFRVVKYLGWEPYFSTKILEARKDELKYLKGRKYLDAICVYLWATTPVLISVLTFATYVLLGNDLTAAKVFTSVALFSMLTGPLNAFPWALNGIIESMVSLKRLSEFIKLDKIDLANYYCSPEELDVGHDDEDVIIIEDATFSHTSDLIVPDDQQAFKLDHINVVVKKGELVGIVGKVGSGKSSLLNCVMGEMTRHNGKIATNFPSSGLGFVQQDPWLVAGTIRDNICFGKNFNQDWYQAVLEACALTEDLKQLGQGDLTRIGEQGSMLSGGQRARLALARAVYQDKDIYLIDDIFSALDSNVSLAINKRCINGLLKHKTRLICTHHVRFLGMASNLIVLDGGKISHSGPPNKILSQVQLDDHLQQKTGSDDQDLTSQLGQQRRLSSSNENEGSVEESREKGRVSVQVYKNYVNAVGRYLSIMIIVSLCLMQASKNFTDLWLAQWVSASKNTTSVTYYLSTYGSIAVVNSIFSFLRAFLFAYGGVKAAKVIHQNLLGTIIKAKSYFFDVTSTGRILNRFSSDLYTIDDSLPFILNILLAQVVGVIGPIMICAYAVPWIILVLVPLSFILYDVQLRYRPASRDLKRIGSVSLSPIYAHFSDTLNGIVTIRTMKARLRFLRENEEKINQNQKAQYAGVAASQWLELRLQLLGCGVVTGIAIIAVIQHHTGAVDPGLVGLAISYALGITGKLSGLVSAFTETEREFVALERVKQYTEEVPVEDFEGGVTSTPYNWPSEGIIVFKDVNFKYAEHLPLALRDLSFETKGREKVGIVGRTGSGKSSIFQVLFRTMEVQSGEVTIDGVNLKLLNLSELRSHLTIIPQHPFLFKGKIRENLDPLSKSTDLQLWDALRKAHLGAVIDRLGGLDGHIDERGRTMSSGQRQLFCVARAILSSAKVVCVDEATANVDLETDRLVQDVLRTALHNCTVITIAHRIESVMGNDRVVTMDHGEAVEIGHPNILLQDPNSKFSMQVVNGR